MTRLWVAIISLTLLTGCAASRQEVAVRLGEQFIGQNVDVMVAQFAAHANPGDPNGPLRPVR
jgi:hypothetical protein